MTTNYNIAKINIKGFKMVKKILLSSFASVALLANSDLSKEVELLKQQVAELQNTLKDANLKAMQEQITETKILAGGNTLKFDADLRSAVDVVNYDLADGSEAKNESLLTNKLIIGMKYAPTKNLSFLGQLGYYKAFGDSANHQQANTNPGYANFDWVTNENALGSELKVKQANFVYFGEKVAGANIPWTASIGRRPSTLGLPSYLREGNEKPQSPLSHAIDVEFDGASLGFDISQVVGVNGMHFKICAGRGLTNAKPRFSFDGTDYSEDKTLNENIDMLGFIFKPYDDGQYKLVTQFSKAWSLIGFDQQSMNSFGAVSQGYTPESMGAYMQSGDPSSLVQIAPENMLGYQMAYSPKFQDVGDMYLGAVTFMANGIGMFINDFLDGTKVFASWAYSKTSPNDGMAMLGSPEEESGYSYYLGAQVPCLLTEDGRIGLEYNHGSKYWRSFTYGEDTMAGSKLATRGDAYEIYYIKPLVEALSMQVRYTVMDYDYTGSNSFFGAEGTPMSMNQALAMGMNPVESASDLRVSVRYQY